VAKRRLTRRQQGQIASAQQERVKRLKTGEADLGPEQDAEHLLPEVEGLVTAHFGKQVEVESVSDSLHPTRQRCHFRANLDSLITGDRVVWRASTKADHTGVVIARLNRHSELARPDNRGQLRPVAANIDQIFIVLATAPQTPLGLIDRYLIAAETIQIQPIIVINKIDLLDKLSERKINIIRTLYRKVGYTCIETSIKYPDGLNPLREALKEHTSIFTGQSGVGKSSLVNTLIPGADIRVSALSKATGKGTHTTTTAQLYRLEGKGVLIDSPGIREFGLLHINVEGLDNAFIEFRPFLGQCRFRNCRHIAEPGCAILESAAVGKIDELRLKSYQTILEEIEAG